MKVFKKEAMRDLLGRLKRICLLSLADGAIVARRTLCISIARGCFSIACGTRSLAGVRIRGFRTYPAAGEFPTPEEVARGAASFNETFRARKYEVALSLPKEWAIAKKVELPVSVRENLDAVVANELDRLTPFEAGEAYYDFSVESASAADGAEKIGILITAVRSDQLAAYLKALEGRNLLPTRLTVNFLNLGTLFAFKEKDATAVFVDIGERGYEAALIVNGAVRAGYAGVFSGGEGRSDGRMRMEAVMKGVSALKRIAPRGKVPEVVIHAGYQAGSLLEVPDLAVTPPFRVVSRSDWGLKIEQADQRPAPVAALGGIVPGTAAIDLFRRGSARNRRPPLALTVSLVAAIASLGLFCLVGPLAIEQNRQAEIEMLIRQRKAEVSRIEERKKEANALGRELAILNGYHAPNAMSLDTLKELTATLPANAWLARVRITEGSVNMEGYTSGSAAEILAVLEKSGTFTRAEFASPTFRDQRMNAERFAIRMDLKTPRTQIPHGRPAGRNS